jgi:hypothetical protein
VLVKREDPFICPVNSVGNGQILYRPPVDKDVLMRLTVSEISAVRDKSEIIPYLRLRSSPLSAR